MHAIFVLEIFDHMDPQMSHPQHPISPKRGWKYTLRNLYPESPCYQMHLSNKKLMYAMFVPEIFDLMVPQMSHP